MQRVFSLAVLVALAACATSSSEALLLPTALTCVNCPTVAVTGIVDGDTWIAQRDVSGYLAWTRRNGVSRATQRLKIGFQSLLVALSE